MKGKLKILKEQRVIGDGNCKAAQQDPYTRQWTFLRQITKPHINSFYDYFLSESFSFQDKSFFLETSKAENRKKNSAFLLRRVNKTVLLKRLHRVQSWKGQGMQRNINFVSYQTGETVKHENISSNENMNGLVRMSTIFLRSSGRHFVSCRARLSSQSTLSGFIYFCILLCMGTNELCVLMIIVGDLFKSSLLILALLMRDWLVSRRVECLNDRREKNKHARHLVMFSDSIKSEFSRYITFWKHVMRDRFMMCLYPKLFTWWKQNYFN